MRLFRPTEEQIQARLVDLLRLYRYTVLPTNRNRRRCPSCRTFDNRPDAMIAGIPDLLVTHDSWPEGVWLGIEMKRDASSRVRPEQQALLDRKRILICWDEQAGFEAVKEFGRSLADAA